MATGEEITNGYHRRQTYPRKNAAYRLTFPIFDADGDLVTGATGPDSEVPIDGARLPIAPTRRRKSPPRSGMYYLD